MARRDELVFFKSTPTASANCVILLQAKELGHPLSDRVVQPQRYVDVAALESVRYVVSTDWPTLFLYERTPDDWAPYLVGHLDVASIQRRYLLPEDTNRVDTLVRPQPGPSKSRDPAEHARLPWHQ